MNENLTVGRCDALLLPFLRATDSTTAGDLLTKLIREHADPVITRIIKSKMRVSLHPAHGDHQNQDALEMASDLRAKLIADIQAVQKNPTRKSITSFRDYVAIKTYSACADYFREKNPQRWRLKNLLRYQLKHNPRFALWKAENNRWYAGLDKWAETIGNDNAMPSSSSVLETFSGKAVQEIEPAQLLDRIFELAGQPVELERIVALAAEVWKITDSPLVSVDDPDRGDEISSVDSMPGVDLLLEQRLYLEKLWYEVGQLPALQRAALLLNLRDARGGSAIFLVPHLGIASQQQIAEMLDLPVEEFSALWGEFPLDDSRIAEMFGLTRQQVINLRKTARERLARRMEKSEAQGPDFAGDSKKKY